MRTEAHAVPLPPLEAEATSVRWAPAERERSRPASGYLKAASRHGRALQVVRELPNSLFLYVLRAAPYPVAPGLMVIGSPDRRSPVLVTANYELTVTRVVRALAGLDCYLLIAPAGGINVWCAAGGGHLSVDGLLSVLKTSRVAHLVDHRRLVLPQLCANGISAFEVKRRTGWSARFGPVRIEDVPAYLDGSGRKTDAMRRVTFGVRERLEMAVAMWGSLTLRYTLFPLLLLGWKAAAWFVPILAALCLATTLGYPAPPGKSFVRRAASFALVPWLAVLGAGAWSGDLSLVFATKATILFAGAALLVGSALPGYSPHRQCSYSRLFFGARPARPTIASAACDGCGMCREVCPVGCFSVTRRSAEMVHPDRCEHCTACVNNCPAGAIIEEHAESYGPRLAHGVCCGGTCK